MKRLLKSLVPSGAKARLRRVRKAMRYKWRKLVIRYPVAKNVPVKVILGAAETSQPGWYATNQEWLDITNSADWSRAFRGKKIVQCAVAEHVFEHLTPTGAHTALELIKAHMAPGGRLRIAVPDGYNPNPIYLKNVGINGIGADAQDHKQLFNADSLQALLVGHGFQPVLVEGFLASGALVHRPLETEFGRILRSRSSEVSMRGAAGWDFPDSQTSLIVDGILPNR